MTNHLPDTKNQNQPSASYRPLIVFCILSWLFMHWFFAAQGKAFTSGELGDTDCYTRLIRVKRLLDTHDWYDTSLPRYNAPLGGSTPWTRPLDVMLIAGMWLMRPFVSENNALYWSGFWISPFLHFLTCMAVYWAFFSVLAARERLLGTLAFIWQFGILSYSGVGRADHHTLITLIYVLILGFLLRCIGEPDDPRHHRGLGLAMAFGIWVSVESQIPVFMTMGTLIVAWWYGIIRARPTGTATYGWYLGLIVPAIVVERRPSVWLAPDNLMISVIHLAQGLLFMLFWKALARFDHLPPRRFWRGAVAVGGTTTGCILLGLTYWVTHQSPIPMSDPQMGTYLSKLQEFQSLWPPDSDNLQLAFLLIGHFFLLWPFLPLLLFWEWKNQEFRVRWLGITIWALIFTFITFWRVRFAYLAEVLLGLAFGKVSGTLLDLASEKAKSPLLTAFYNVTIVGVLLFTPVLFRYVIYTDSENSISTPNIKMVCADLNNPALVGKTPATIVTSMNYGPEIVYRTPHSIIAAPYLNLDGVMDVNAIFRGTDDISIREILHRRQATLLLIFVSAKASQGTTVASQSSQSLETRLVNGQIPVWMTPIPLIQAASSGFRLFRVAESNPSQVSSQ